MPELADLDLLEQSVAIFPNEFVRYMNDFCHWKSINYQIRRCTETGYVKAKNNSSLMQRLWPSRQWLDTMIMIVYAMIKFVDALDDSPHPLYGQIAPSSEDDRK